MSITNVDAFTSTIASKKQIKKLYNARKRPTKSAGFSYGIANAPIRKQVRKK